MPEFMGILPYFYAVHYTSLNDSEMLLVLHLPVSFDKDLLIRSENWLALNNIINKEINKNNLRVELSHLSFSFCV